MLVVMSLISTDPLECLNTTFFPTNATLLWNFNQTNGYNLTCDRSMPNGNTDNDSLEYLQNDDSCTIIGLSPFTSYTCNVTEIVNSVERPLTRCLFTTAQACEPFKICQIQWYYNFLAPGPVTNLSIGVVSSTSVVVRWSPVAEEETNGVIQFYQVVLREYGGLELNRSVVSSTVLETRFSDLGRKNIVSCYQIVGFIFRGSDTIYDNCGSIK